MDSENYYIPQRTADLVNDALDNKRRVCTVGTTSMRSVESSVSAAGKIEAK